MAGRLAIGIVALVVAGCARTPVHYCDGDEDCPDGTCVATEVGDQRCTTADGDCDSGRAWDYDAGDLAGTCLDPVVAATENACLIHPVGREVDACASIVCDELPRCCTHEWGQQCVRAAERACDAACGAVAAIVGDELLWVGAWDGELQPFWTAPPIAGLFYLRAAWGDLDDDGRPELATCATVAGAGVEVQLWHNDGAAFSSIDALEVASTYCRDLDWVDADADGDLDVVVGGTGPALVENLGGSWAATPIDLVTGDITSLDWADLDDDGRLDVAVSRVYNSAQIYQNTVGGFELMFDTGDDVGMPRYWTAQLVELDDEAGIDLLLGGDFVLHVLRNTAASGFASSAQLPVGPEPGAFEAAVLLDADADHDLDVFSFHDDTSLKGYQNELDASGPGFSATPRWDSGAVPFDVDAWRAEPAAGDVDGDGHTDLIACAHLNLCRVWLGDGVELDEVPVGAAAAVPAVYAVALTGDWR